MLVWLCGFASSCLDVHVVSAGLPARVDFSGPRCTTLVTLQLRNQQHAPLAAGVLVAGFWWWCCRGLRCPWCWFAIATKSSPGGVNRGRAGGHSSTAAAAVACGIGPKYFRSAHHAAAVGP
jgi:hypothetical protein